MLDVTTMGNGYDVDSAEEDWQGRYSPCCDYFGLFPMCEEAKCGENSSIMKGDFGVCLQGTHPYLKEGTEHYSNLAKTIHNSVIQAWSLPCTPWHSPWVSVRLFWPCNAGWHRRKEYKFQTSANVAESFTGRNQGRQVENFISGEDIGTEITPRCGFGFRFQDLYPTTMVVPLLPSRIPSEPSARMSGGPRLLGSK